MINLKEILNKIKDIISKDLGVKKVFDKDVAEALAINQTTLATMKRRNSVPYKEILEFCAFRKISINWLIFNQITQSIANESEKFENIHYFKDIYASAGGGALNYDEKSDFLILDKQMIEHFGSRNVTKNMHALNILGDSMEPTLNDGDIAFVDKNSTNLNSNGIYIVSTPVGLFVKRLQLKKGGKVVLISDNKSYPDEIIEANDAKILGKVVGSMSNNF